MANETVSSVRYAGPPNSVDAVPEGFAWRSLLILFAFFMVILALFLIGLGCAYLSYRHATNRRNRRLEKAERERLEKRQQQFRYKALAAAQYFRGIPNSYTPNPKDENSFLLGGSGSLDLDFSTVPVHMQTQ